MADMHPNKLGSSSLVHSPEDMVDTESQEGKQWQMSDTVDNL